MTNLPVYFVFGFVTGELWKQGSHGLAGSLVFAACWLMVSSYFVAKQQKTDRNFIKEIQTTLKEKGYG